MSRKKKKRTEAQERRYRAKQSQRQLEYNERQRNYDPELALMLKEQRKAVAANAPLQRWDYKNYIRSADWRIVRASYFASRMRQNCVVCGATERLQLHHRSYKNLGREGLHDLEPLCQPCHSATHDMHRKALAAGEKLTLFKASKRLKTYRNEQPGPQRKESA